MLLPSARAQSGHPFGGRCRAFWTVAVSLLVNLDQVRALAFKNFFRPPRRRLPHSGPGRPNFIHARADAGKGMNRSAIPVRGGWFAVAFPSFHMPSGPAQTPDAKPCQTIPPPAPGRRSIHPRPQEVGRQIMQTTSAARAGTGTGDIPAEPQLGSHPARALAAATRVRQSKA